MDDLKPRQTAFFGFAGGVVASVYRTVTKDGTVKAVGREAIKDTRSTIHEIFFGRPEGHNEPGTPLNPTQGEIASARKDSLMSPSECVRQGRQKAKEQDHGKEKQHDQGKDKDRGKSHGR